MDSKLDTVRRGLEIADAFCGEHTADECPDTVAIPIKSALAALSAIDPEAPGNEALVEKVITFFNNRVTIGEAEDECGDLVSVLELDKDFRSDLAKMLSVVDPEAIRRECAYWLDELTKMVNRLYDTHRQAPSPDILGSLRIIDSQLRASILSAEPAQDDGKPDVVMTMIENGDLTISWECSGCKKLIDDKEDIESMKKCPHCGAPISNFLYIEEARS